MVDSKYMGIPFGTSGDKATIPEATQPGGQVSYQQGFGPDYERDPATDPLAKRVPRDETNEFYYQVSNAVKFLQLYGRPEWYALDDSGNPVSYPLSASVRHNAGAGMQAWRSLVANNTTTPGADLTKWALDEAFSFTGLEATLAEALAGSASTKLMTPRRASVPTQRGAWTFAATSGSANALIASLTPVPSSLTEGMEVRLKISTSNTGPASLNLNGLGAVPIVTMLGATLAAGDLPQGAIVSLSYVGTSWVLSSISYGEVRRVLTGNLTLYVRTDGNDNNTGLIDSPAGALATIAGAWNKIQMVDPGNYSVTIQMGVGAYAGFQFPYYSGTIRVKGGNNTTKQNYNFTVAVGQSFVFRNSVRNLILEGVSFNYNYTGPSGGVGGLGEFTIGAYDQSSVAVIDCNYNCAAARLQLNHNVVDSGCLISNTGLIGVNGGVAIRDFASAIGGGIFLGSATYTTNPSPLPINNYFAESSLGGIMNFAQANFSGASATGARYAVTIGGILNTGGGGPNFLPGSAAGVVATGGLYA